MLYPIPAGIAGSRFFRSLKKHYSKLLPLEILLHRSLSNLRNSVQDISLIVHNQDNSHLTSRQYHLLLKYNWYCYFYLLKEEIKMSLCFREINKQMRPLVTTFHESF